MTLPVGTLNVYHWHHTEPDVNTYIYTDDGVPIRCMKLSDAGAFLGKTVQELKDLYELFINPEAAEPPLGKKFSDGWFKISIASVDTEVLTWDQFVYWYQTL